MKKNLKHSKMMTNKHKPGKAELPQPSPPNYSGYQEKQPTNHPIPKNKKGKNQP